jgi:hypothetical protein
MDKGDARTRVIRKYSVTQPLAREFVAFLKTRFRDASLSAPQKAAAPGT